ncbi:MAG: methionyl-tRNA formyltransferase [Victivallaceae bacterium]|nr:methionyl-tRNA formyltransferase [Victivallaceae bacterium]
MLKPKVYFLGSGKFAVPVLESLVKSDVLDFVGGATGTDRPGKRGRKLVPTPVASAAETLGVSLEKTDNVNSPDFISHLTAIAPDIVLVASFGQLLRGVLLALPKNGCVNIHPSTLPKYRGASPVVQCVLNRDAATEVCFMAMEKTLDSGAVFRRIPRQLNGTEYADELEAELGGISGNALGETLVDIASGKLVPIPQSGDIVVCGKIDKNDGIVDWTGNAENICAMVRAYHGWPGACCFERQSGLRSVISRARVREGLAASPGEMVMGTPKSELVIGCGSGGAIEIQEIVPAGGKAMTGAAFRNGRRGLVEFVAAPSKSED